MKFLVLSVAAVLVVASAAPATQAEIEADKAIIENMVKSLKNSSLSADEKKTAYNTAINSLQGPFLQEYKDLCAEIKATVTALPDGAAKTASQKFIDLWESGALFGEKDQVKKTVHEIFDGLTEADKNQLKGLQEQFGKKFKEAFKDIMPSHADFAAAAKSD